MKKLVTSFVLVPVLLVAMAFSAFAEVEKTEPVTSTERNNIVLDWLDPGW